MVHADASNFSAGVSKAEAYEQVLEQAEGLVYDQRNWVCNLANVAALLWHAFKSIPEPSPNVNWAGFYVLDPKVPEQLILGPFMGKVACQTIKFGRGVCGKAAKTAESQIVKDVHAIPDHIACDDASKSEIVVPVVKDGKVVAVIDVDSAVVETFDEEDKTALESLAKLLAEACDW
ncbi:GAF domain-like protein [Ascodesmis nigricans]|uniref:GAF domain-like protein n=1 Tax=Ascodesmis nigricans TaxID=341454 RepID=A0A4V3SHL3_9PEZI|nr:GAF domain-like protein [Ascodesmis nigricans]